MIPHEYFRENAERVVAERFLTDYLQRPTASLAHAIPDWMYTWLAESWFIEITSVSLRPKDHRLAYRQRLVSDPGAIDTVPSSSGRTAEGHRFETYTVSVADEMPLAAALREALRKKGPSAKRYGAPERTHLVVDASGDQVDGTEAMSRVLNDVVVPDGYPYVEVLVWFALSDWDRRFVRVRRA